VVEKRLDEYVREKLRNYWSNTRTLDDVLRTVIAERVEQKVEEAMPEIHKSVDEWVAQHRVVADMDEYGHPRLRFVRIATDTDEDDQ